MRTLSALLLMLILPGLLLPGGVALRVCLCAWTQAKAPSCCAAHPEAQHSCCSHRAPAPQKEHDGQRVAARGSCHCLWLAAPDEPSQPAPANAVVLHAAPPPFVDTVAIEPAVARQQLRTWPSPHSRPPPPDRQRSLPLRL